VAPLSAVFAENGIFSTHIPANEFFWTGMLPADRQWMEGASPPFARRKGLAPSDRVNGTEHHRPSGPCVHVFGRHERGD
jgi:hypothetical protein